MTEVFDMRCLTIFLQIIDFLVAFPPQGQALELVRSTNNSEKEIFPLKTPFKALYSLNTLMTCLREMSLAVEVSVTVLQPAHAGTNNQRRSIRILCLIALKSWSHS